MSIKLKYSALIDLKMRMTRYNTGEPPSKENENEAFIVWIERALPPPPRTVPSGHFALARAMKVLSWAGPPAPQLSLGMQRAWCLKSLISRLEAQGLTLYHSLDSLVGVLFVNEPESNELRILLTLLDEGTLGDEVSFCLKHMTNTSKSWAMDGMAYYDVSYPLSTPFIRIWVRAVPLL
jgi:hypothetical protein